MLVSHLSLHVFLCVSLSVWISCLFLSFSILLGNFDVVCQLEKKTAEFVGKEDAIVIGK